MKVTLKNVLQVLHGKESLKEWFQNAFIRGIQEKNVAFVHDLSMSSNLLPWSKAFI